MKTLPHLCTAKLWSHLAALAFSALALSALSTFSAHAAWPERSITLLVPFAPGGSSDNVARTIAPLLGEKLGKPVVIENVAGAGGMLGTQRAVRATPDGYTIFLGSGSEILINKLINPKVGYDGMKDLSPVVFVATGPMVLVGSPSLPANSVAEVLALAKARPGGLSYASAGNGTPMNVAGELLKMRAGIFMTHIPYRGASPALVDVMGGQIELGVSTLSAAQPFIKSGKLKAFAVTATKPSELAPEIPALGQIKGLEGFDLGVWFGLFLPNKTPPEILQKIQQAAQQVLTDAQVQKRLTEQGIVASGASADALGKFMASEVEKYRSVVKAANIRAD